MISMRDAVWSLLICGALTLFFECRPAWDAQRFVERESQAGFLEAYAGHRFMNGEIIQPASGGGMQVDPLASTVMSRHFEITAMRMSWNGKKVELLARHLIQLAEGDRGGTDASQDVRVQLEKQGGHWIYTLFEVRERGPIEDPNGANPWSRAIRDATAKSPPG
jgi:hypothetical protein